MASETGEIRIAGASVSGSMHSQHGVPCQDAHGWVLIDHEVCAVVAADGAGTSARGDAGAQIAVEAMLRTFELSLPRASPGRSSLEELVRSAVETARSCVARAADGLGGSPADYHTTLQVVVAYPDLATFGLVGDGACVIRKGGSDQYRRVIPPQQGEYANQTFFLPCHPSSTSPLAIVSEQGAWECLVLMTDGIADVAVEGSSGIGVPGFLAPVERLLHTAATRRAISALEAAFTDGPVADRVRDDRTLVMATRTGGEG